MGWRYRKSFKIAPGLRLNMGKGGFTSISVGGRGATLNLGKRGVTSTVSLPGTGLSYQHRFRSASTPQHAQALTSTTPALTSGRKISMPAYVAVVAFVLGGGYLAVHSPAPSGQAESKETSVASPVVPVASAAVVKTASPEVIAPNAPLQIVAPVGPSPPLPTRQITAIQANVRAAPSMSGAVLRTLLKGQVVQVLQVENGWMRVAEHDGEPLGWVHSSVLR
jgi:uncharacterized protein YgiM (DUF1202 family)